MNEFERAAAAAEESITAAMATVMAVTVTEQYKQGKAQAAASSTALGGQEDLLALWRPSEELSDEEVAAIAAANPSPTATPQEREAALQEYLHERHLAREASAELSLGAPVELHSDLPQWRREVAEATKKWEGVLEL